MRVLLIARQQPLVAFLKGGLAAEGYAVDTAKDGNSGDCKARSTDYDAIVLELDLPEKDGLTLVQGWRKGGRDVAVLALTTGERDRVNGLDAGADECLDKPFPLSELLARLRSIIRRRYGIKSPIMRIHDLEIDTTSRTVKRGRKVIPLSRREFALLEFLAYHRGKVVSRALIWEHLYDEQDESTSNVVEVYIRSLRKKICKKERAPLIQTRWGQGYLLVG
jgi:DNA-binding response OmpR family regulator